MHEIEHFCTRVDLQLCLVFGKRQTSAKSIIKKKQQKNKKTLK
jgi:hypothetical protein